MEENTKKKLEDHIQAGMSASMEAGKKLTADEMEEVEKWIDTALAELQEAKNKFSGDE